MGRHSDGRRRRLLVPALATVLVLVAGAAAWATVKTVRARPTCEQPAKVLVTASADIAPALSLVARGLGLQCGSVEIQTREATQAAERLALSDGSPRPQVWVPDSTLALRRAHQLGADDVPETGASVASSPVVLAVAADVAKGIGWPDRAPTWAEVLAAPGVVPGMPDPARDAVGAVALLGLRDSVKAAPEPSAAYVATLRRFSANTLGAETDLMARLPGSSDGGGTAAVTAFPASENSLLRHNIEDAKSPLVAVYSTAVPTLDYPFAELGGITPQQRPIVDALRDAVLGDAGADAISKTGLRAAGGQALREHTDDPRVSPQGIRAANLPPAAAVDELLNQWAGINLSARVQVLIDVSGSMNAQVPGTGLDRMQVTMQAAAKAMHLFKPATQLRMLAFSTRLDGDKDYRELLPMAPVAQHLATGALDKLARVRATADGGTGLYDSVLDTYRTARREWEPGRLNLVIVMTDGRNEDPRGISRPEVLAELAKLQDPRRPIPLIGVGIGPDADQAELTQLTSATGGQTFVAPDPAKITDVFFGALSRIAGG
ncbi:von Willebrand factor type A domain-containing protein [Amycolatopsis tolypomycina]|uniref:von Willebrand factor type A domain-containing protein n=1 Tax=Amycolatopsis tolypomycina TaxID=208445 RepID=A0A1H4Z3E3_9PSEU|nr:substrate-binding domain-containing protein [Amycolatopsis tolypomycina]SED24138.1 von Willebrand factor type A domain-containing protein [Amycolatopsis tolypomycina]